VRIADIKQAVGIDVVLEHYGAEVPWHGSGWVSMRCPFHDDNVKSASVNLIENVFACMGCDVRGDIVDLVQDQESCDTTTAKQWLEENLLDT